jgi:hypothetical protein
MTVGQEIADLSGETPEVQVQRLRSRAAIAMVVASVAIGFIAGRASVWLLPFDSHSNASAGRQAAEVAATKPVKVSRSQHPSDGKSSKPPTPLPLPERTAEAGRPAKPEPQNVAAPSPPAVPAEADKTGAKAPGEAAKTPSTAAAGNTGAAPGAPEPPGKAEQRAPFGATLINPGRVDAGADAQDLVQAGRTAATPGAEEAAVAPAGIEACDRHYSSFRRSDLTYQPYGGGPRARCPLLR